MFFLNVFYFVQFYKQPTQILLANSINFRGLRFRHLLQHFGEIINTGRSFIILLLIITTPDYISFFPFEQRK